MSAPPTYGMPATRRPSTASSAIQFHRPHRGQLQLPPVTRHCDPGTQVHAKEPPPTYGMPTTRRLSTASSAIQFHRPHRGQLQLPPVTRNYDPGAQVHAEDPPPTYGMPATRRLSTTPPVAPFSNTYDSLAEPLRLRLERNIDRKQKNRAAHTHTQPGSVAITNNN